MSLSLDENSAQYQIKAFQPGIVQINDETYKNSLIISANQLIENWRPQHLSELTAADLKMIEQQKPDILLIGTGEKLVFPKIEIYGELLNQGIGVEIMNTGAACRTFNALTAEGRNVIAALILK